MSRRADDVVRISSGLAMVLVEAARTSRVAQSLFQQDAAELASKLATTMATTKNVPDAFEGSVAARGERVASPQPSNRQCASASSSRPSPLRGEQHQMTFTASAALQEQEVVEGVARQDMAIRHTAADTERVVAHTTLVQPGPERAPASTTYIPHVSGAPSATVQAASAPLSASRTPAQAPGSIAEHRAASVHSKAPLITPATQSTPSGVEGVQGAAPSHSSRQDSSMPIMPVAATAVSSSRPSDADASDVDGTERKLSGTAHVVPKRRFRERAVPSSRVGRALGFAGLGAGLAWGAATDAVSRALGPADPSGSQRPVLSEGNARRLANALCRMRGAALKIGQMLSIQDEDMMPPQVAAALEQVRQSADVMPRRQLEATLRQELGDDWHTRVAHFEWEPSAAASIGQVHKARLHDGRTVAMKIQYPGVATSIESDVDNLVNLMNVFNVLPKGLFIDEAVTVAKQELALECDYRHEARCQQEYFERLQATPSLRDVFAVPELVPELSAQRVITGTWLPGTSIDKVKDLEQATRDRVGTSLLQLTLHELYLWRFMQTDPNFGNFLYDEDSGRIALIDFGAARHFPKPFVDDYLRMVKACAEEDRAEIIRRSVALGFLTGEEPDVMLDAHVRAGATVGTPFGTKGIYDFGAHGQLTRRVSELGAKMLQHRLTAPPVEAYSLHRRLSGAFLANIRLRARVPCQKLFDDVYSSYDFAGADAPGMKFAAPISRRPMVPPQRATSASATATV